MTTDVPPSVEDLGESLVQTSLLLFLLSPLLGPLLGAGAGALSRALALEPATEKVFIDAVRLAPLHLNLLSPLLAKRLIGLRARRLLQAESIFLATDDGATWRLFARATVVTAAALAVYASWWAGVFLHWPAGMLLELALLIVLWPYRVVVVTVRWFRHAGSLPDSVGVLSREASDYRSPERFFLGGVEGRREVVLERVDGASLTLRYVDAARLAAASGVPAERLLAVEGVRQVWRAPGPGGARVVAAWLGRS